MLMESDSVSSLPPSQVQSAADKVGVCLSSLCVLHCLVTLGILLFLPSLSFLGDEFFHHLLILVLPVLAILAFIPGYRRHKNAHVFLWALAGLAFISVSLFNPGHFFNEYTERATSIIGSLFLIRAHLMNRRLCACACHTH